MQTTNLMESDSGVNTQARAFLADQQVQSLSEDEKYFLTPAIITSIPIVNGSVSGSIEISSAHGVLEFNDAIDTTIDVISVAGGINVGVTGISLDYGAYLFKESVSIDLFGDAKLELGTSLGFGKEAKFTEDGFKIGFSNIIGGSIAITWDSVSKEYYLRALLN